MQNTKEGVFFDLCIKLIITNFSSGRRKYCAFSLFIRIEKESDREAKRKDF